MLKLRELPTSIAEKHTLMLYVYVSAESNWVSLDVMISPLVCPACNRQLEGLYEHGGSRYGHVGNVTCDFCKARISCTDNDNLVERLNMYAKNSETGEERRITLIYSELYRLEHEVWEKLKALTGYDIYNGPHKISLEQVMQEIGLRTSVEPSVHAEQVEEEVRRQRISELPPAILRWFALRRALGLDGNL